MLFILGCLDVVRKIRDCNGDVWCGVSMVILRCNAIDLGLMRTKTGWWGHKSIRTWQLGWQAFPYFVADTWGCPSRQILSRVIASPGLRFFIHDFAWSIYISPGDETRFSKLKHHPRIQLVPVKQDGNSLEEASLSASWFFLINGSINGSGKGLSRK